MHPTNKIRIKKKIIGSHWTLWKKKWCTDKKDRQINVTTLIHYCVLLILIWHIFLNHLINIYIAQYLRQKNKVKLVIHDSECIFIENWKLYYMYRVKQSSQNNAAVVITQDKESLVWLSQPLKKQNIQFLKIAKNNHKKS